MDKGDLTLNIALGIGGLALGRMIYDPLPGNSLDGIIAAQSTCFIMLANHIYETIKSTKNKFLELSLAMSPAILGSGIEYLQSNENYGGNWRY